MVAMMRKGMQSRALFVLLPFAAVVLLAFAFVSCDTGSAPESATGPDAPYDPLFDEPRPGVTARVSPSTVTTPDPVTDNAAEAVLIGYYRDPNGSPVSGIQMNFTADPVDPNITMNPSSAFTDDGGGASTRVFVGRDTPPGSYILVAYTSPASAGPNARGQTTLYVNQGEIVSVPNVPSGPTAPTDTDTGSGITASGTYATDGSRSNLGNPVTYRFDCGNGTGTGFLPVGSTSTTCNYSSEGTFQVRAQARSVTGVTSDWSAGLQVTITNVVVSGP